MDWIDNLWAWLQGNNTFASWMSAVVSVLAIIGIPTIVSMAKTLSNSKENKSYRTVTLVRVLWMAGFISSILAYMADGLEQDETYNEQIANVKRMGDLKRISAERKKVLEARKLALGDMTKVSQSKVNEYERVPDTRKRK